MRIQFAWIFPKSGPGRLAFVAPTVPARAGRELQQTARPSSGRPVGPQATGPEASGGRASVWIIIRLSGILLPAPGDRYRIAIQDTQL